MKYPKIGLKRLAQSVFSLLIIAALSAPVANAQISGISYSFSPSAEYVFFEQDEDAGFANGLLYGGELGFGFGRSLEVTGEFLQGNNFSTAFITDDFVTPNGDFTELPIREIDLQRYGGRLRVNIGGGALTPFLTGGSGLLRFNPSDIDASENIYAALGAGITYRAANRFTLTISGQQMAYRFNPGTAFYTESELLDAGITAGTGQRTVTMPSARASLAFHLGGRTPGQLSELDLAMQEQFGRGGSGIRLFVEPFYGRLDFNEALGFPKGQNLGGVNAGVQFGPYVGLRGFYWRGMTGIDGPFDDFAGGFENIALYGGELNLHFTSPMGQRGFTPFGILGMGYLNSLDGYEDNIPPATLPPEDRYFATLGGGVEIPVSRSVNLQGNIRNLLMSTEDVRDLDGTDSVYGSWMYSAGITFSLGGRDRPDPGVVLEERLAEERRVAGEREVVADTEIARLRSQIDSLEAIARQRGTVEDIRAVERLRDEVEALEEGAIADEVVREPRPEARRTNLSGETVTLPIPEVGEIYIRIGETDDGRQQVVTDGTQAGALTQQQIEQIVRSVMQAEMADLAEGEALASDEIRELVREVIREEFADAEGIEDARIQQLEERLQEEAEVRRSIEEELIEMRRFIEGRAEASPREIIVETEDGERVVREAEPTGGLFGGRRLSGIAPSTGLNLGPDGGQLSLSLRADFRRADARIRILPELGVGLGGGGLATNIMLNAAIPFLGGIAAPFEPYAGVGFGLLSDDRFDGLRGGVNLLGGAEYPFGFGSVFGEFNTVNFLETTRLHVGYRVRF